MTTEKLSVIEVKGRKIRTNNQNITEIQELWQAVPEMALSGAIYAVYSNYASDFKGDYDLLVGSESAENTQANVEIIASEYLVLPVASADIQGVQEMWQHIWENPEINQLRTYQTDFEYYAESGEITIYLSI